MEAVWLVTVVVTLLTGSMVIGLLAMFGAVLVVTLYSLRKPS